MSDDDRSAKLGALVGIGVTMGVAKPIAAAGERTTASIVSKIAGARTAPAIVAEAASLESTAVPDNIYRGATPGNPNHVKLRAGEEAVSFRGSLSNALPEAGAPPQPVLKPGRNFIDVQTSKLPAGSVAADGGTVVKGVKMPHGHVSVTASEEAIVNATVGGGKLPK